MVHFYVQIIFQGNLIASKPDQINFVINGFEIKFDNLYDGYNFFSKLYVPSVVFVLFRLTNKNQNISKYVFSDFDEMHIRRKLRVSRF